MKKQNNEWYSLRSILGNDWAMFYFLLGGREAGKSYATTEFFVRQYRKYGRPFYWLRLTDTSAKKLLNNKAEKLIDPDIRRKYKLDLTVKGDGVYEVLERNPKTGNPSKTKRMARVLALNTFYNDKGSGLFDKDFLKDPNMYYNICLDEMNREQSEKKSFDIVYAFANQIENLIRSTKQKVRIICIGNTLDEASDILSVFDFLPQKFGRYYLKNKKCVIDYIEPSEEYLKRRKDTAADILAGNSSTFTNQISPDLELIDKSRVFKPTSIIKFHSSNYRMWFTVWDGNKILKYNKETVNNIIAMKPYMRNIYNKELQESIIELFDTRYFKFRNLLTLAEFKHELELLKPRKSG